MFNKRKNRYQKNWIDKYREGKMTKEDAIFVIQSILHILHIVLCH